MAHNPPKSPFLVWFQAVGAGAGWPGATKPSLLGLTFFLTFQRSGPSTNKGKARPSKDPCRSVAGLTSFPASSKQGAGSERFHAVRSGQSPLQKSFFAPGIAGNVWVNGFHYWRFGRLINQLTGSWLRACACSGCSVPTSAADLSHCSAARIACQHPCLFHPVLAYAVIESHTMS